MINRDDFIVRKVENSDRKQLSNLIHFEFYVHHHLDWCAPLDWIGKQPFLVVENKNKIIATLACPPDPKSIAWIRLFASSVDFAVSHSWNVLWLAAKSKLIEQFNVSAAASISMKPWFQSLLERSGYREIQRVVLLEWSQADVKIVNHPLIKIRPVQKDDLKMIEDIDAISFAPLWQNSLNSIRVAFNQAVIASIAEWDGQPAGYQISTSTPAGGHLARLAVIPQFQRRGIGTALLMNALDYFSREKVNRVTVSTQHDNISSLSLYKKLSFMPTGQEYPILEYQF